MTTKRETKPRAGGRDVVATSREKLPPNTVSEPFTCVRIHLIANMQCTSVYIYICIQYVCNYIIGIELWILAVKTIIYHHLLLFMGQRYPHLKTLTYCAALPHLPEQSLGSWGSGVRKRTVQSCFATPYDIKRRLCCISRRYL